VVCRGKMALIRMKLQFNSAGIVLMLIGTALISSAQMDKTPPQELIQHVRDAKRQGVAEAKIKRQAVAVGWPAEVVDQAIAYAKSGKESSPSPRPAVESPTPSLAPDPLPAAPPPATSAAAPNPAIDPGGSAASRRSADDYQIGSGDTLHISVWKEPDASVPSVVVRPDGKITVPLIKELEVVGLTPKQVEQRIAEGLQKFIASPDVTVVVMAINSKKIYIVGAARKEGPLPYTYGMSVIQALSEAGGVTDYAKRKKIYILRSENGREYRLDFNYDEVVKGERMEQNILLMPGDTVVIPH
jgi:polysaccharide export outer membrane protein